MAKKILFIGGTGVISTACSHEVLARGMELYHLNRGKSPHSVPGVRQITGDIRDTASVREKLGDLHFDAVVDWIAYLPEHVRVDAELFAGRTQQYVFISSASAYAKPIPKLPITEDTPMGHPFSRYSRDKADCEEVLARIQGETGFPVTVVRPSHTYGPGKIPIPGGYTVIDRMRRGKKVVVPGDGTSVWTLTHNTDFARGFTGLLGNERAIGEAYHITSDEWLTWDRIHVLMAKAAGAEARLVHLPSEMIGAYDFELGESYLGDKKHSKIFDNSKIRALVPDFRCTVPFAEGAKDSIAWCDASPERQAVDPEMNALMDRMVADWEEWMLRIKGR